MHPASPAEYFLEPGYIYFSKTPSAVRAVVGSCVAVCLWDRALRYGGMSHFLRPRPREGEPATPQVGTAALAALVRMMDDAGCSRTDLVAQIAGGASPRDGKPGENIGTENAQVARAFLSRKGIDLASEDTGGTMGRKLIFDTATGQLAVLKVFKIRKSDWGLEE